MFKKGDKVECVDKGDNAYISNGCMYVVDAVFGVEGCGQHLLLAGTPGTLYKASRFKTHVPMTAESKLMQLPIGTCIKLKWLDVPYMLIKFGELRLLLCIGTHIAWQINRCMLQDGPWDTQFEVLP